jgi:hypothetical protein
MGWDCLDIADDLGATPDAVGFGSHPQQRKASMPSPGWQVLRFVAMMNAFLLCVSDFLKPLDRSQVPVFHQSGSGQAS